MERNEISVIINSLGKGGAEKLTSLIFPRFQHSTYKSKLLVLTNHENEKAYLDNLGNSRSQATILDNQNLYKPSLLKTIAQFVQKSSIIHCHLFPTIALAILAKKIYRLNAKIVYTEHGIINKKNNRIRKTVIRWIYKNCDALIALTEDMKSKMSELCSQTNKIHIIENGIDLHSINNIAPTSREALYQIEGVKPTARHFIMMTARFEAQKDHTTLIHAMQHLDDHIVLLLAGVGELMEEYKSMVANLNLQHRVIFLGFRGDVISLMKTVDINILSTHFEGLSGVALEGLAAGKPFLGSKVAGVREVCPNDDFAVEPLSTQDLCTKINNILNDTTKAQAMATLAGEFVKKYSLSNMFDQHLYLYNQLMGNPTTTHSNKHN